MRNTIKMTHIKSFDFNILVVLAMETEIRHALNITKSTHIEQLSHIKRRLDDRISKKHLDYLLLPLWMIRANCQRKLDLPPSSHLGVTWQT